MAVKDPEFMTVAEVAIVARVSKMTVYRWIESGDLPAVPIGRRPLFRIRSADVRKLLGE